MARSSGARELVELLGQAIGDEESLALLDLPLPQMEARPAGEAPTTNSCRAVLEDRGLTEHT